MSRIEIMKFAEDNNLLYIGESSALADINIKEVVETLMESKTYSINSNNQSILGIHEVQ